MGSNPITPTMKKIIINAKEFEFSGEKISYEDIVSLVGGKESVLYTVTFHHHKSSFGVGGSLVRGESTLVYDGMIINCTNTSNA